MIYLPIPSGSAAALGAVPRAQTAQQSLPICLGHPAEDGAQLPQSKPADLGEEPATVAGNPHEDLTPAVRILVTDQVAGGDKSVAEAACGRTPPPQPGGHV